MISLEFKRRLSPNKALHPLIPPGSKAWHWVERYRCIETRDQWLGSEKHQQPSISEGIIQVVSVTWRDLEYLPIRFEWTQTTGGPKLVCFCWVLILTYYCLQAMYNFLLKISGSNGGGAGSPSCGACFCIPVQTSESKGI